MKKFVKNIAEWCKRLQKFMLMQTTSFTICMINMLMKQVKWHFMTQMLKGLWHLVLQDSHQQLTHFQQSSMQKLNQSEMNRELQLILKLKVTFQNMATMMNELTALLLNLFKSSLMTLIATSFTEMQSQHFHF